MIGFRFADKAACAGDPIIVSTVQQSSSWYNILNGSLIYKAFGLLNKQWSNIRISIFGRVKMPQTAFA
jgi:hypothetical protein